MPTSATLRGRSGVRSRPWLMMQRNFLVEGLNCIVAGISPTLRRERPDRPYPRRSMMPRSEWQFPDKAPDPAPREPAGRPDRGPFSSEWTESLVEGNWAAGRPVADPRRNVLSRSDHGRLSVHSGPRAARGCLLPVRTVPKLIVCRTKKCLDDRNYDLLIDILRFCGSVDGAMASSKPCRGGAG